MANTDKFKEIWQQICRGTKIASLAICNALLAVFHFVKMIVTYLFRMRKIIMAVPVVLGAVRLAQYCHENLPAQVGLFLQEDGTFLTTVARDLAVFGPLLVTAVCLLLMFCSRRTLYPWLISIFSLALPLLIVVTNIFPA